MVKDVLFLLKLKVLRWKMQYNILVRGLDRRSMMWRYSD